MAASQGFIIALVIGMVCTGAANTLVYKAQNSYFTSQSDSVFRHPFMQAVTMFFGEFICIFLFLIYLKRNRAEWETEKALAVQKGLNPKLNYFYLIIPAAADFFTSNMQYIALNYIAPSLYQMLRGGVVLVTAAFTVIFLKKPLFKHNYVGCVFVVIGIACVGMSKYIFPPASSSSSDDDDSSSMATVAIILVLISLISNGVHFVSEEKIFLKYHIHPFQMVGSEGLWGLSFYVVVLPLLMLIPCPDSFGNLCMHYEGESRLEFPGLYFKQIGGNGMLCFYVILGIFTIATFNVCGVNVTKNISSLARSLIDVTRTVLVWGGSIIVTLTAGSGNTKNFQWESLEAGPILVELLGFAILVFGNLVYNKIIVLPFAQPPSADELEALLKEDEEEKQKFSAFSKKSSIAGY